MLIDSWIRALNVSTTNLIQVSETSSRNYLDICDTEYSGIIQRDLVNLLQILV